jgi:hypothetical protein
LVNYLAEWSKQGLSGKKHTVHLSAIRYDNDKATIDFELRDSEKEPRFSMCDDYTSQDDHQNWTKNHSRGLSEANTRKWGNSLLTRLAEGDLENFWLDKGSLLGTESTVKPGREEELMSMQCTSGMETDEGALLCTFHLTVKPDDKWPPS